MTDIHERFDSPIGDAHPLYTRRSFLGVAGAVAATAMLSSCGVKGVASKAPEGSAYSTEWWRKQRKTGRFVMANWPLYIDRDPNDKSRSPSLGRFTQETGITVDYREVIQDWPTFLGQIEPSLAAGQPTGYDMVVCSNDEYLQDLIRGRWLIPLDHTRLPNFFKYAGADYKNPNYDPGNRYTVPWESGIQGIAYDPRRTGRKITSWQDLCDPRFKGKIGMLGNPEDIGNVGMLAVGIDPASSTQQDWKKALLWLQAQKNAGIVRSYYTSDYIGPLSRGDLWIAMAYSGDIYQANLAGAHLDFIIPKEGAMYFTANLCILVGAAHPLDALMYANYVFEPRAASMMAEGIEYIPPVPAAQSFIEADARAATGADAQRLEMLAHSPLVFPSKKDYSLLHRPALLTQAKQNLWNTTFEAIYMS